MLPVRPMAADFHIWQMGDFNYEKYQTSENSYNINNYGYYGIMQYMGITCPIKYITGISCAGCGMTRAWIALLHFDINTAFMYHPLFFLPPVALIIFLLRKKLNKKLYYTLFAIILAAFIIVYIYRLFNCHDGIVVFEPQNNIIHRIFDKIAIKSSQHFS